MSLTIVPAAHAAMLDVAAAAAPHEACGLLLGKGVRICAATAAANVHPRPATHFEIDPAALIAAHRAAREGSGPQVLGYWHSHPNGRAGPSDADRAAASGDGRIWAIVASGNLTVWRDGPDGFERLPYEVVAG